MRRTKRLKSHKTPWSLMAGFELDVEFSFVCEKSIELYFHISSKALILNTSTVSVSVTSFSLSFLYHYGTLKNSSFLGNEWS